MDSTDNSRVEDFYQVIMFIAGESAISRKILVALAHLYPKSVSVNQLVKIIEYSQKSRVLSRGILDDLEQRTLIFRDKLTRTVHAIRINDGQKLMKTLIDLCFGAGQDFRALLLSKLEEGND